MRDHRGFSPFSLAIGPKLDAPGIFRSEAHWYAMEVKELNTESAHLCPRTVRYGAAVVAELITQSPRPELCDGATLGSILPRLSAATLDTARHPSINSALTTAVPKIGWSKNTNLSRPPRNSDTAHA